MSVEFRFNQPFSIGPKHPPSMYKPALHSDVRHCLRDTNPFYSLQFKWPQLVSATIHQEEITKFLEELATGYLRIALGKRGYVSFYKLPFFIDPLPLAIMNDLGKAIAEDKWAIKFGLDQPFCIGS
jgi:hypothetical protein